MALKVYDATGTVRNTPTAVGGVYYASLLAQTPVAAPTDVIRIKGSATKTVRIKKIELWALSNAVGATQVSLIRRSAAGTDNASTTYTNVTCAKADSSDGAASAVVSLIQGANLDALGATAGTVAVGTIPVCNALSTSYLQGNRLVFDFSRNGEMPLVLRGTSEFAFVNFGGTALVGTTNYRLDFNVVFEEDDS